jgi:hypothetical protein
VKTTELIPSYADVFPFVRFYEGCKIGGFTNDDGHGYLASSTLMYLEHRIDCSNIAEGDGKVVFPFTHVAWFNK